MSLSSSSIGHLFFKDYIAGIIVCSNRLVELYAAILLLGRARIDNTIAKKQVRDLIVRVWFYMIYSTGDTSARENSPTVM